MVRRFECSNVCKSRASEPSLDHWTKIMCDTCLWVSCSRNQVMNLETLVMMTKRRYGYTPWYNLKDFPFVTQWECKKEEIGALDDELLKTLVKPDLYNFVWEGCPGQIAPCCEIEPGLDLKMCLQAIIRCEAYVGLHYLMRVFLRNNSGVMRFQRIYLRKVRLL